MTRLLLLLVVAVRWLELPAAASPALSAGELFSCTLDGGRVACWGFNRHVTDAVTVSAGFQFSCAVTKAGRVM